MMTQIDENHLIIKKTKLTLISMFPDLQKIIANTRSLLIEIGELSYFAQRFFRVLFTRPFEFKELLIQCYNMGNKSMLLVGVTGFILGLVFTLQSRPTLMEFGAESWMPSMVSISIVGIQHSWNLELSLGCLLWLVSQ